MERRSTTRIVRVELNIKFWIAGPPEIDAVRPAWCPGCGKAGAPLGERVRLVGHGVRTRSLCGPLRPGEEAAQYVLFLRRFRCQDCSTVVTVAPLELAPGRQYAAGAIALALMLFGVHGLPAEKVLERIQPKRVRGHDRRRWRALDRWVLAMLAHRLFSRLRVAPEEPAPTVRGSAAFLARQIAAFSRVVAGPLEEAAMDGAMMAVAA